MSNAKFVAFLFLVMVWMPGCFVAYIAWLPGSIFGTRTVLAFVAFFYAIFGPILTYSFWDEFGNLFKSGKGADGDAK